MGDNMIMRKLAKIFKHLEFFVEVCICPQRAVLEFFDSKYSIFVLSPYQLTAIYKFAGSLQRRQRFDNPVTNAVGVSLEYDRPSFAINVMNA